MADESSRTETFVVSGQAPSVEGPSVEKTPSGTDGGQRQTPNRSDRMRQKLVGLPYAEQCRLLKPGPLPRSRASGASVAKSTPASPLSSLGPSPGQAGGGRRRGPPGVRVGRVSHGHTDVTGSSLAEVAPQLPAEDLGLCEWSWSYTASYDDEGNARRVTVSLALRITMPRWRGPGRRQASDAARTEWDRCMGALEVHENGHADRAREWAPRLRDALLGQPEDALPDLWEQTKAQHEEAQAAYDAETNHGRTQGSDLNLSVEPEPEAAQEPAAVATEPGERGGRRRRGTSRSRPGSHGSRRARHR